MSTTKTAKRPVKKAVASKTKVATKPKATATPTVKASTKTVSKPSKAAKGSKAPKVTPTATKPSKGSKATGGQSLPRDLNEHGFVKGSDSEKIVNALLAGGADRLDVNKQVLKALGNKKTRHGTDINVSSLVANILRRLKDKGYTIESSWKLVEPTAASKAAATRRAKKAVAAKSGDTTPAVTEEAPAKPVAAKKAQRKPAAKKTARKPASKAAKA